MRKIVHVSLLRISEAQTKEIIQVIPRVDNIKIFLLYYKGKGFSKYLPHCKYLTKYNKGGEHRIVNAIGDMLQWVVK